MQDAALCKTNLAGHWCLNTAIPRLLPPLCHVPVYSFSSQIILAKVRLFSLAAFSHRRAKRKRSGIIRNVSIKPFTLAFSWLARAGYHLRIVTVNTLICNVFSSFFVTRLNTLGWVRGGDRKKK